MRGEYIYIDSWPMRGCIPDHVYDRVLAHKVTRAESEEERGAGIVEEKLDDSSPHPPVPLVDEVILEVAVDLPGQPLLRHAELRAGTEQAHLGRVLTGNSIIITL